MNKAVIYLMTLLLSVCVMCCISCKKIICEPGATQPCYCSDGEVKEQVCKDDGSGWAPCVACTNTYTYWNDPSTNLTWQDPQKDAYNDKDIGVSQPDGVQYCKELVLGGYNDWRLPTIDELRTIVRGNPHTETDGDCPMTEGSPRATMNDPGCMPITEYGGPGEGGCYWTPELNGTCDKPDPAANGHPLETCTATVSSDNPEWIADVMFDNGAAPFNHILSYADVRCVRTGPTKPVTCAEGAKEACEPGATRQCTAANGKSGAQVCADNGMCWGPCDSSAFTPTTLGDVCPTCDQVNLTIKVPQKLTVKPKQIMAFLFSAQGWTWPPQRPPDGGTSDDQVMNPDIDVDKPLKVTVPGCTYYRDECLSGEYYLYIALMQTETMPPTMLEGDYWWGMPDVQPEPLKLGTGNQQIIDKEIMLVPYEP